MAATQIEPVYLRMGRRIGKLRRDRGLTQERVAAAAGVSANYLARVEGGQHRATLPKLEAIAVALNVTLGAFFDEREPARKVKGVLPGLAEALVGLSAADQRTLLAVVRKMQQPRPRRARSRSR